MTSTLESFTAQLRENTGCSFLDSGDYYGRGYDRWSKISDEDVRNAPGLIVYEDYFTIDTAQWLSGRADVDEKMTKIFQRWATIFDPDSSWPASAEKFAERMQDGYGEVFSENTYNRDSSLSETLQYVVFTRDFETYALIQTHNGCDMRGGYSSPVAYRIEDTYSLTEETAYAWHDVPEQAETLAGFEVPEQSHSFHFSGPWEGWTDQDGTPTYIPTVRTEDGYALACPECGEILEVGTE